MLSGICFKIIRGTLGLELVVIVELGNRASYTILFSILQNIF